MSIYIRDCGHSDETLSRNWNPKVCKSCVYLLQNPRSPSKKASLMKERWEKARQLGLKVLPPLNRILGNSKGLIVLVAILGLAITGCSKANEGHYDQSGAGFSNTGMFKLTCHCVYIASGTVVSCCPKE